MMNRARPEQLYEIAPPLMAELSDRENPCELIALLAMREDGVARMAKAENPLYVLFDRPQSPGPPCKSEHNLLHEACVLICSEG
jgi:hypothetical protein